MRIDKKIINWIEDIGTSTYTLELREGIERALQGVRINLLFDFDWVREELKCGENGLWVIESGFPTRLSGLVQRIKEEHPKARIIVYHPKEEKYEHPYIDAQVDISSITPRGLAEVISRYLN